MKRKFLAIEHKSFADLGVATYKELWEQAKAQGFEGISICVATVMTKAAENKYHAVFSSSNEDRHGDVVQQVFDLGSFMKNPVFLDSHNYDSIEHIIGKVVNIGVNEGKLQGDIEFALDNPKGVLAMNLAEKGFLNATSIGFIPKVFDDKGFILESELLEISAVSVPANADALFEKKAEEKKTVEPVKVEPVIEKKAVSHKSIAVKVTSELIADRKRMLHSIAKNVQELTEQNRLEKKRKIFQTVRNLLNQEH